MLYFAFIGIANLGQTKRFFFQFARKLNFFLKKIKV